MSQFARHHSSVWGKIRLSFNRIINVKFTLDERTRCTSHETTTRLELHTWSHKSAKADWGTVRSILCTTCSAELIKISMLFRADWIQWWHQSGSLTQLQIQLSFIQLIECSIDLVAEPRQGGIESPRVEEKFITNRLRSQTAANFSIKLFFRQCRGM